MVSAEDTKMTIWVNTVVNNEENFIWFSLMSVIDYVDKILVWDTGSTDKTVEIVKEVIKEKGKKIEFKEVGSVNKSEFTKMRQAMLEQSNCDWILILDGDEIWWEDSIKRVIGMIDKRKDNIDAIAVPFYNAVGDIYHYQSQDAGKYEINGMKGHLTIRAIRRGIQGLHLAGPYGAEGYVDGEEKPIQQRDSEKLVFMETPFIHLTHLRRSSINSHNKFKHDLGLKFIRDFHFPEVLYLKRPDIILSPWRKRSKLYEARSTIKGFLKK